MTHCVITYTVCPYWIKTFWIKTFQMNGRFFLLRRQLGMSLQSLADASGLTKSYLSKVERGLCVPSIAAAIKIAGALKVDVTELFSGDSAPDRISVVRSNQRLQIRREDAMEGSGLEVIAAEIKDKHMLPFVVAPPPRFTDGPHLSGHAGEEFLFVVDGQVEVAFPARTERLMKGDAIYFDALIPHQLRSVGEEQAMALVVISSKER